MRSPLATISDINDTSEEMNEAGSVENPEKGYGIQGVGLPETGSLVNSSENMPFAMPLKIRGQLTSDLGT